jgi:hypothetical protein
MVTVAKVPHQGNLVQWHTQAKCGMKFTGYHPSPWEQHWFKERQHLQSHPADICARLAEAGEQANAWITTVANSGQRNSPPLKQDTVFSYFTYYDECLHVERRAYIEPLVGNFRHPAAIPSCPQLTGPPEHIESRDYVLLHGVDQPTSIAMYPGKKYLFDLGTSWFETSLAWFIDGYAAKGITFDEVWAWEVRPLEPNDYWKVGRAYYKLI